MRDFLKLQEFKKYQLATISFDGNYLLSIKKFMFHEHISAQLDDFDSTIALLVLHTLLKCEEMCKVIWNFLSEINQSTPKLSVASD